MTNEQANENPNPTSLPDRIWAALDRASEEMAQLRASQRETDRQMQETDRRLKKTEQLIQETARQMKDTDRRLKKTERLIQETAQQMKDTDRRLDRRLKKTERRQKKVEDLFTTQWGRLMESLVEGDLVPLLKQRGIAVEGTSKETARRRNGESFEIDILAVNGREVVVVEVKTTLRSEAVKHFLSKLARFQDWSPEYRNHTIYGAVAYLRSDPSVVVHAERQGLFVIRATGNSASIVNGEDFVPRSFS